MGMSATPWVEGLTIGQVLRETARRHGDRPALVFPQFQYRRRMIRIRLMLQQLSKNI